MFGRKGLPHGFRRSFPGLVARVPFIGSVCPDDWREVSFRHSIRRTASSRCCGGRPGGSAPRPRARLNGPGFAGSVRLYGCGAGNIRSCRSADFAWVSAAYSSDQCLWVSGRHRGGRALPMAGAGRLVCGGFAGGLRWDAASAASPARSAVADGRRDRSHGRYLHAAGDVFARLGRAADLGPGRPCWRRRPSVFRDVFCAHRSRDRGDCRDRPGAISGLRCARAPHRHRCGRGGHRLGHGHHHAGEQAGSADAHSGRRSCHHQ